MEPRFFDRVIDKNDRVNNFFEGYFYLDGISGKLGAHTFKPITPHSREVRECKRHATIAGKMASVGKILSYVFLPIPALMLLGKGINRCIKKYQVGKPLPAVAVPVPPKFDKKSAEKHLEALYKTDSIMNIQLWKRLTTLKDDVKGKYPMTPLGQTEGNLSLLFKNDKEVFFSPKQFEVTDLNKLTDVLSAAFATGHKMVVTQLGNDKHAVAAAFMEDGTFRIIDSMVGNIIEAKTIKKALNEAHILDRNGKVIKFKGDYIHTIIQRGGVQCTKFSLLYCYQMAKTKRIDAYKEVHGAFVDGKLKSFEDYTKIEGSRKVSNMLLRFNHHDTFMRSWAHRCAGFKTDDWRSEIKIRDMFPEDVLEGKIGCYLFRKNNDSACYSINNIPLVLKPSKEEEVILENIEDIPLEPIELPKDFLDQPLSKFIPKNNKYRVVFFFGKDSHRTLKAFKLPKGVPLCHRLPKMDRDLNYTPKK